MLKKMMLIILLGVIGVTLFGNGKDYIREWVEMGKLINEAKPQLSDRIVAIKIKDNGVTDAEVYKIHPLIALDYVNEKSGSYFEVGTTVVAKNNKFYIMPDEINELLKDDKTEIDSLNVFDIAERFVSPSFVRKGVKRFFCNCK
jgi:hypothetical protein